jgi:Ni/Co efflux regulator RcnB
MKKFLLSALAISMVATPALAAQPRDDYRDGHRTVIVKKEVYRGAPHRGWRKGERFDYRRAPNDRVINDYRVYRLKAPPRGYRYVRSGNDAVLVGITSGLIAGVIAGAIH